MDLPSRGRTVSRWLAAGLPLSGAAGLAFYATWIQRRGAWFDGSMHTGEVIAVIAALTASGLALLRRDSRRELLATTLAVVLLLGFYLHTRSDITQLNGLFLVLAGFSLYGVSRDKIIWAALIAISCMLLTPLFLGPFFGLPYVAVGVLGATALKVYNEARNSKLEGALRAAQEELARREKAEAALRREEERYRLVAHGTNDGWWDWNLETGEVHFSPRWKSMLGYAEHEIGSDEEEWFGRVHPDDVEDLQDRVSFHIRRGASTFRAEYRIQGRDGEYRWMACRGVAVPDENGKAVRLAGSQTDITRQKSNEQRLQHQAFHDELTGLPNRAVFIDHLKVALRRIKEEPSYHFAVLFLDLDRFKVVNDSLGHLAGDELLKAVAQRLVSESHATNVVCRLGGDEFAVLLDGLDNVNQALAAGNNLRQRFRRPFNLAGRDIFVTPSIGIAWGRAEYQQPEDLLRDSDTAMYQAKTAGRDRCELFRKRMHSKALDLLQLENDLRRAVENLEFCLHYQPIVSLETYEIVGIEALLRWEHPEQGLLTPGQFLEVAEETGLIMPVYWWVLEEACRYMVALRSELGDVEGLTVSVNLSGRQFDEFDLVERVKAALSKTGLPASRLCLEITEHVLMNQSEPSVRMLKELQAAGIQIHLDDFGTGYSSLGYLNRFSFDALKIDRSFIQSLAARGENMKIVRAMVDLAHNLSMDVIVEGLETIEQIETMKSLKSNLGQGYYFSHPLSGDQIKELLRSEPQLAVFDFWRKTKTG